MTPKQKFNQICKDIKSVKIQGAENIAKAGFLAYKIFPNEKSRKILLSLRPTEPMLENILNQQDKISYKDLLKKLKCNKTKINKAVFNLIKNNQIIFTHCHSSSVIQALIYAKKHKKNFEVYNTETRPLYQGRKTSKELKFSGIKVTMFVDSAALIALAKGEDKEEKTKPVNLILLGADAITKKGVINKVGSGMIAELAKLNKIPLYIVSDSLKFTTKKITLEQRSRNEVWSNKKIRILNPAFEFIPKKYVTGIISEFGTLKFKKFLRRVKKK